MRKGGTVTNQGYRVLTIKNVRHLEHRVVMERIVGRKLFRTESVHHKNGDRLDNAPSNLELWDRSQPFGQRVVDKIDWCRHFLSRHGLVVITASP